MSLSYFARYRFNQSDLAKDDFGFSDLAVETGDLDSETDPDFGLCLRLDGATSFMSTGDFTGITGQESRCFAVWAKSSSSFASPVLSYGDLEAPNAFVFYSRNEDGNPEFFDYGERHSMVDVTTSIDVWTHFAFNYSSDLGIIEVYVDGAKVYEMVQTLTTGTSDPLRIGTDGLGEYFTGSLLDLRIYDLALDSSAIEYLASNQPNYHDQFGTLSFVSQHSRSNMLTGHLLCRDMYGVQDIQESKTLTQAFYGDDDSEVVRVEHGMDESGLAFKTVSIQDDSHLLNPTIHLTNPETIFSTNETHSVVFSSAGVHLVAGGENGCMYFGGNRQFRFRVNDGKFVIEAHSSATDSYQVKMEVA